MATFVLVACRGGSLSGVRAQGRLYLLGDCFGGGPARGGALALPGEEGGQAQGEEGGAGEGGADGRSRVLRQLAAAVSDTGTAPKGPVGGMAGLRRNRQVWGISRRLKSTG
ncbi:hypothetical protein GCM10010191_61460 [Actinomadura vinacea]|uniref:Uncharacterized protein n=1 Tax=Actinomadura vinacea TaxID=115336 RepID=A0ABN3JV20_9ACTN